MYMPMQQWDERDYLTLGRKRLSHSQVPEQGHNDQGHVTWNMRWQLSKMWNLAYWNGLASTERCMNCTWWRHQMETFSVLLVLCAGNSPVTGEFPSQRPEMWSFDTFSDLHLNKPLSKHFWGWWFQTPHAYYYIIVMIFDKMFKFSKSLFM